MKIDCNNEHMMKHVCGNVNRHNCRNWGSENLLEVREVERDSPKLNVWSALMKNKIIRLFLFAENSVTGKKIIWIYCNTTLCLMEPFSSKTWPHLTL
ncbi:hypothetical protein C0J52_28470 [Blattella germanica]|nr:hypothetical protein C0J52_28470 [Blattella germanica]